MSAEQTQSPQGDSTANDVVGDAVRAAREALSTSKDEQSLTIDRQNLNVLLGHIGFLDNRYSGVLGNGDLLQKAHADGMGMVDAVSALLQRTMLQVQVLTAAMQKAGLLVSQKGEGGDAEAAA